MISLYYTGANKSSQAQVLPEQSLGGYASATQVPNDLFNNLFRDTTIIVPDESTVRCIALRNIGNTPITNLSLYLTIAQPSKFDYLVAITSPATDVCGSYVEFLSDERSSPFTATAFTTPTQLAPLALGTLNAQAYLMIWIKRTPVVEVQAPSSLSVCQQLYNNYTANIVQVPEIQQMSINFVY